LVSKPSLTTKKKVARQGGKPWAQNQVQGGDVGFKLEPNLKDNNCRKHEGNHRLKIEFNERYWAQR